MGCSHWAVAGLFISCASISVPVGERLDLKQPREIKGRISAFSSRSQLVTEGKSELEIKASCPQSKTERKSNVLVLVSLLFHVLLAFSALTQLKASILPAFSLVFPA